MEAEAVIRYLADTFDGVVVIEHEGDHFVSYDPDGDAPADHFLPFVTVVTGDRYDRVSRLDRPGHYRLNIGLTRRGYTALFGPAPTERDGDGILATGFDYAATDRLMPHPVYASQYWVCVLNPGPSTWDTVRPLLAEAYDFAARKHANRASRASAADAED